jgi:hypothetical protein
MASAPPSSLWRQTNMKNLFFLALLLSGSLLFAQNDSNANPQPSKDSKGQITITGCVSQFGGDYTLIKDNLTYELQAKSKTRLKDYLGQRVQITGKQAPTLSSSSDALGRTGSAAPTTITIDSIKTIDKTCSEKEVNR